MVRPDAAAAAYSPAEPISRKADVTTLQIRHRTTYRYWRTVNLGPHWIMVRPRDSRDLRLLTHELTIHPSASVSWAEDVSGNAVATAAFHQAADTLVVESVAMVECSKPAWPVFRIAASALSYPFRYSDEEWTDLGALAHPAYADPSGRLKEWADGFVMRQGTDTLSLLTDICAGIASRVSYQSREEEGTQGPLHTLDRGWGSCRDFAVLFAESARTLGFGARIVSGYLYNPDERLTGSTGSGSTHAWAEVFVPGAGWIPFDPTNRSIGGFNLIPVATVRNVHQASPVRGSFSGMTDAFRDLSVQVSIQAM